MDKIIYDGDTYYIKKGIVYDSMFLQVSSNLAKLILAKKYEDDDYKSLNEEQLLERVKDLKNAEIYEKCIKIIKFGLDKFIGRNSFYRTVFPILTSCYRFLKQPQKAVDFWIENRYVNRDCISPAFLTSVAGAYCDVDDYETA
ncbi:MAG: hypothetical protein IKC11_04395 [Clostridia bacterium]|nr:hypothetical protein [Clostridia bacterium]